MPLGLRESTAHVFSRHGYDYYPSHLTYYPEPKWKVNRLEKMTLLFFFTKANRRARDFQWIRDRKRARQEVPPVPKSRLRTWDSDAGSFSYFSFFCDEFSAAVHGKPHFALIMIITPTGEMTCMFVWDRKKKIFMSWSEARPCHIQRRF